MRTTLLLLAALFVAPAAFGQTVLISEDFEDATVGYTLTFDDTAGETTDYFRRTDGSDISPTFTGFGGSSFFAAQDIDGVGSPGAASPANMTFSGIDITGQTDLNINFKLAHEPSSSWDVSDQVLFIGSIDGGAEFPIVGVQSIPDGDNFNSPDVAVDFNDDGDGDAGSEITDAFRFFSATIGQTGSSLTIRIEFSLDSGGEDIALDDFAVTANGALPVELTSFTAQANGNAVNLRWETASETNNTGFEVQMDGGSGFARLDFVQGAGTTLEASSYDFRVEGLAAGSYRFRLKQVDLDGSFEFSPVVELAIAPNGYAFSATSSFRNEAVIDLSVERAQDVTVAVYNLLGRRVATLMSGTVDGSVSLRLDGGSLASGVYLVRADGETFSATRQVVRVR